MSAPSPSWYDVLDVDPSASPDEIRAAWKSGIAELDPSDRRFRLLNQAAEVLLDAEQRAAYDRELAPEPMPEPMPEPEPAPAPEPPASSAAGVPAWLLAGVAILTVIFVGLSVWQTQRNEDDAPSSSTSGDATPDDARDAQTAAEKAAVAITAYDFRDLEGSRNAAVPFMTDDYEKRYEQIFAVLEENAPTTKTIVTAELVASAVGLVGEDRIQVLVFFDRSTTNAVTTEPQITRDQATLTMKNEDGEWLVDDLTTTLPGS